MTIGDVMDSNDLPIPTPIPTPLSIPIPVPIHQQGLKSPLSTTADRILHGSQTLCHIYDRTSYFVL